MTKSKKSFLEACHKQEAEGTNDTITRGQLKWLIGKPAAAEEGFGAVAISDTTTIVFNADDLVSAEDTSLKGVFRIGLSPDASVLVRESRVVDLSPCDCGDDTDPGRVPLRYDLNKVVGFDIDSNYSVVSPGIPGYTHPCIKARNKAFDNCMRWPGSSAPMCGAVSAAAEVGCLNQFF